MDDNLAFGGSICLRGDLDGDGYADLAAGADSDDTVAAVAGATYVTYGAGL